MDRKTQWMFLVGLGFLTSGFLFALNDRSGGLSGLTNYPNPFNSRTEETFIAYQLPQDLPTKIRIYDLFGFQIREFNFMPGDQGARAGENKIRWDGTDESGQKVARGGYVCQVTVEGNSAVRGIRKIGVLH